MLSCRENHTQTYLITSFHHCYSAHSSILLVLSGPLDYRPSVKHIELTFYRQYWLLPHLPLVCFGIPHWGSYSKGCCLPSELIMILTVENYLYFCQTITFRICNKKCEYAYARGYLLVNKQKGKKKIPHPHQENRFWYFDSCLTYKKCFSRDNFHCLPSEAQMNPSFLNSLTKVECRVHYLHQESCCLMLH